MSLDAFGLQTMLPGGFVAPKCGNGHPLKRLGNCVYCRTCHFSWSPEPHGITPDAVERLPWVGRADPFRPFACSDCGRDIDLLGKPARCLVCDPRCQEELDFRDGTGAVCIQPPHLILADKPGEGHIWSKTAWNIVRFPDDASRWTETGLDADEEGTADPDTDGAEG